jgi:hypothetical protein
MIASLIGLLFALIIIGVVIWAGWKLIGMVPMPEFIRVLVIAVVVIICVLLVWNFAPPLLSAVPHGRLG